MWSRRTFLASTAALATLGATATGVARKLVFVVAQGGWDPTRVLAPAFGDPDVDVEAAARLARAGDLAYVDHPGRPSVRVFFEAWGTRCVVINGVLVPSIAHETCAALAMTGDASGHAPDWATRVAAADVGRRTLPHLVLGGPSYAGDLGAAVVRTGSAGQLDGLLTGEALEDADSPARGPSAPAESRLDRWLSRRAAARARSARGALDERLAGELEGAVGNAIALKDLRWTLDLTGGARIAEQARLAADALALGLARCVTLGDAAGGWDTHTDNDRVQSIQWESLFAALVTLMGALAATPGEVEATLADETVVVVLSEMGRAPRLNAAGGKDHWPWTSVLLVGPGLAGGRVVGAFGEGLVGAPVDANTGEPSSGGETLTVERVGATVLALAGAGASPIGGVLA
ncbi:MAG: DUF1501 domain-containing protein [Myxococcota bacterium]